MRKWLNMAALSALLAVVVSCTQKAPESVAVLPDRGVTCAAVKQVFDDADKAVAVPLVAGGKMTDGSRAGLKATAEGFAAKLRAAAPGDAELSAALGESADALVAAVELLSAPDPVEAAKAIDGKAIERGRDGVKALCREHWQVKLSAANQQVVTEACEKIQAAEAADGATASSLWSSLRTGAVTGSTAETAKVKLVGAWERLSDVYDGLYFDIENNSELRPFRSAMFQVGAVRSMSADLLTSGGVAEVEKYQSQEAVRDFERDLALYCG